MTSFKFCPFSPAWRSHFKPRLFYAQLEKEQNQQAFWDGLFLGLGYFGLGISWVFVSIHEYGHLHSVLAALITLCFLIYLSLFPALMALIFKNWLFLVSLSYPVFYSVRCGF
nr:hypothetical protein [Legionella tunisiensis]